jgi:polysaccharide pyruvyl transferase WcaK-like protein
MSSKTPEDPRVLLFANTGTDGDGFIHVGDEAMFLEMHRFYRERFPQVQLSSLVGTPLYHHLALEERQGLNWPSTKKEARIYFLKLIFKCLAQKYIGISLFSDEQSDFVEFIRSHDLVHFTGGGNLTSECEQWFYYALFVAACSILFDKPVIMTSQTIGPFSSWIDAKLAYAVLNRVESIVLREFSGQQRDELRRNGLTGPEILNSLDAAFFLERHPRLEQQDEFQRSKVLRIGLSVHESRRNSAKIRQLLQNFLPNIAHQEGVIELLLLPHVLTQKRDRDEKFMSEVVDGLPDSVKIIAPNYYELVDKSADIPVAIKAATASCDVVVTSRYHGVIYALSENVPVLTIVGGRYQCMKNVEALRHVFEQKATAYLTLVQRVESTTVMMSQWERLRKNLADISKQIARRNDSLLAEYTVFLGQLEQKISRLLFQ